MKKRLANKQSKQLANFALVCERLANTVVDKVSAALRLQSDLDEYQRFLGDLLIMLAKKEPQCVLEHSVPGDDKMGWIWKEVHKLIKENNDLREQLAQSLKEKDEK